MKRSYRNNVALLLERHSERAPQRTALLWASPEAQAEWRRRPSAPLDHARLTNAEFVERSARIGRGLLELGVGRGDTALVFLPMSVELYAALAALQRIGAIAVFLDSWARRDQLAYAARIVAPRAILATPSVLALCDAPGLRDIRLRVAAGCASGSGNISFDDLAAAARPAPVAAVEPEHPALVTFTTGSSGVPKGANRTHRFLAAQHTALQACIPYQDADVDLPVFPVFALNSLAAGIPTVLPALDAGSPREDDPDLLLAQMRATEVTCATLSPGLLRGIAARCQKSGQKLALRRIVTGGAPLGRDDLEAVVSVAPRAEVRILYGSTEVEPMAGIEARAVLADAMHDPEGIVLGVDVGRLVPGLRCRFLRPTREPIHIEAPADWQRYTVPEGEPGELAVAGLHVCRDYYADPEAFRRAKIRDCDGTVWHRTGDVARLDARGHLRILGRVHNTVQRAGQALFPVPAEMLLRRLPTVRQAAYVGMPDATLGELAVCALVPVAPALSLSPQARAALLSEVRTLLAAHDLPVDRVVLCDSLPMDPRHHSKVEYDLLRQSLVAEGVR
jgi:acyl-coenzyme A synthetase/AMP-(fatty) acid ligase